MTGFSYVTSAFMNRASPVEPNIKRSSVNTYQPMPESINDSRHLELPSLATSLNIKQGLYDSVSRTWTLDQQNAFQIKEAATPIFYSHNKKGLFDQLAELKGGELLIVTTAVGERLNFRYVSYKTLDPEDAWILNEITKDQVILFTCTGLFFEARNIFYFQYEGQG